MCVIPNLTKCIWIYVRNCHHSLGFQWLKYTNVPIYSKEIWHELWCFNDNFMHFVEYSLIFHYRNFTDTLFFVQCEWARHFVEICLWHFVSLWRHILICLCLTNTIKWPWMIPECHYSLWTTPTTHGLLSTT